MSNSKTNGQATSGVVEAVADKVVVKSESNPEIINVKRNRIHDLEGFCKQSLDKIGVFKLLEGYEQQITELSNILKESSTDVKIVVFDGSQERLRVSKPDVIEDVLKLLKERNTSFMNQLINEIVE